MPCRETECKCEATKTGLIAAGLGIFGHDKDGNCTNSKCGHPVLNHADSSAADRSPAEMDRLLMVRRWAGPDCSLFSIAAGSLAKLKISLQEMAFGTPKLYYFNNGIYKSVTDRIAICDEASFSKYLEHDAPRPPLLAFYENSSGKSPLNFPAEPEPIIEAEEKSQSHATSRSSQDGWSDAVKSTDGFQCVVCKTKTAQTLEGAHHIGDEVDLAPFELQDQNEVANGYCMCASCHKLYDAGYFWIDLKKIVVSNALQQEVSWKARHEQDVVLQPKRKGRNLMTDEMREFRKNMYEEKQKARHERRDNPLACQKCGKTLATILNKVNHEDKCKKSVQLVTPLKEVKKDLKQKAKIPKASKNQKKLKGEPVAGTDA